MLGRVDSHHTTGEHQTSEKVQLFRHNPPDILVTNPETLHYQVLKQSYYRHAHTRTWGVSNICRTPSCTEDARTKVCGNTGELS